MAKPHIGQPTGCPVVIAMAESAERARLAALLCGLGHPVELAGEAGVNSLGGANGEAILILDPALPGLSAALLHHRFDPLSARRRNWTIVLSHGEPGATTATSPPSPPTKRCAGADDILPVPVDEFELRVCMRTALRMRELHAEMVEAIEAAQFHASHDSVTGLWNREALLGRLYRETDRTRRQGSPLAFLLLDLDRFSQVNREHGYDGGDNVLRQLASRFRRHLRSYDLCGRCGEDQFLIAMPGGSNEDAGAMAARLRGCVMERPFDILKASAQITASLGIAQSAGRSPLLVLREAESALASAKRSGGDCFRFFVSARGVSSTETGPACEERQRTSIARSIRA
jgi:diguanylate cyclase (GGDEF)-like protein